MSHQRFKRTENGIPFTTVHDGISTGFPTSSQYITGFTPQTTELSEARHEILIHTYYRNLLSKASFYICVQNACESNIVSEGDNDKTAINNGQ